MSKADEKLSNMALLIDSYSKFSNCKINIVENAKIHLTNFRKIAHLKNLSWCDPHISFTLEGEIVFEWWNKEKKLTIYFQENNADYIKVWGANIHSEMEDGELTDFSKLLEWLLNSDVKEILPDPHSQWIKQNFDELRKYPDMFVALDPERGILVHATDQSEFAAKLETLSPEENERVTLFHTSMYLRG